MDALPTVYEQWYEILTELKLRRCGRIREVTTLEELLDTKEIRTDSLRHSYLKFVTLAMLLYDNNLKYEESRIVTEQEYRKNKMVVAKTDFFIINKCGEVTVTEVGNINIRGTKVRYKKKLREKMGKIKLTLVLPSERYTNKKRTIENLLYIKAKGFGKEKAYDSIILVADPIKHGDSNYLKAIYSLIQSERQGKVLENEFYHPKWLVERCNHIDRKCYNMRWTKLD